MIKKVIGLYYSPVGGTKMMTEKIARDLAGKLCDHSPDKVSFDCYDLEGSDISGLDLNEDNIVVIGTPVYMGKIPLPAAKIIHKLKGNDVMTLVSVSYGGRSYGNALFELQHYAEDAGFKVIGAGAFTVFCKSLLSEGKFIAPAIDISALVEFEEAVSSKIKRLTGSEVKTLKVKPAPVEAPGRMPVHRISKISPKSAAVAQRALALICFNRRSSEWYL